MTLRRSLSLTSRLSAQQVLTMRKKELNKAENDLEYLKERLIKAEEPLVATSWQDTVDSWLELAKLLPKMRSERGVLVLESVFADVEVANALGLAKLFLKATGDAPESLMIRLKQTLGKHIKANSCARHAASPFAARCTVAKPRRRVPLTRDAACWPSRAQTDTVR